MKEIIAKLGCHQRPDRSFFFRGHQFPVCARCTGVLLGQIISITTIIISFSPNIIICVIGTLIMFIDWLIQYRLNIESTNLRRLITGTMCGYGLMGIYYIIGYEALQFFRKIFFN
jgi:uncharacterized membrane protein